MSLCRKVLLFLKPHPGNTNLLMLERRKKEGLFVEQILKMKGARGDE